MNPIQKRQAILGIGLIIVAAVVFLAYASLPVSVPAPVVYHWPKVQPPPAPTPASAAVPGKTSPNLRHVSVTPGSLVTSPLKVTGEAQNWYFEAVFGASLLDGNGKELVAGQARAQSDWTAGGFIPFETKLDFALPETATGTLILENDNPSGLPQNSEKVLIPVRFRP
jgi:hypothetical protein